MGASICHKGGPKQSAKTQRERVWKEGRREKEKRKKRERERKKERKEIKYSGFLPGLLLSTPIFPL